MLRAALPQPEHPQQAACTHRTGGHAVCAPEDCLCIMKCRRQARSAGSTSTEWSVSGPSTNTRMLLLAGSWTAPPATCTHRMDAGQLERRPLAPLQPQAQVPAVSAAARLMILSTAADALHLSLPGMAYTAHLLPCSAGERAGVSLAGDGRGRAATSAGIACPCNESEDQPRWCSTSCTSCKHE